MFKKIIPLSFSILLIFSCSYKHERPSTALDTGRAFIRATLDGDFDAAQELLYPDSMNVQYFNLYKTQYDRSSDDDKKNYKTADYTINKYDNINDSVTIIDYSNSYMKQPLELKVVRKDNEWQIDFKYTISGNVSNN
jgi:hypothetical protein